MKLTEKMKKSPMYAGYNPAGEPHHVPKEPTLREALLEAENRKKIKKEVEAEKLRRKKRQKNFKFGSGVKQSTIDVVNYLIDGLSFDEIMSKTGKSRQNITCINQRYEGLIG